MKLIVLTGSDKGAIGYFVSKLHELSGAEISMVVVNAHEAANLKRSRARQLKKLMKIGLLGALNGIRMRKWYGELMHQYLPQTDLADYCRQHSIPLVYTPSTNHDLTVTLFRESGADVGISLGNDYISSKVFSVPPFGMINVHGEILPDYQNAQSVIWQIYNGSGKTGYTIHKVTKKIDGGEILFQEGFDICWRADLGDTVSCTCAEITKRSADGLVKVVKDFEDYYKNAKPQGKGGHYTTPTFRQYLRIKKNFKALRSAAAGGT